IRAWFKYQNRIQFMFCFLTIFAIISFSYIATFNCVTHNSQQSLGIQLLWALDNSNLKIHNSHVPLENVTYVNDAYHWLFRNGYPYPISDFKGKLQGPAIVNTGVVIAEDSDLDNITIKKWKSND